MTENPKIPERCSFKIVELKKKWRQRTAKLELRHEFDEVVTNQRITMCFDFYRINDEIEEAEKEYHAAMHKNKSKLLDTDDDNSMSNEVRRKKERLDWLEKRKKELRRVYLEGDRDVFAWQFFTEFRRSIHEETHADFSFDAKVIQHKLKFKDEALITEMIYQVDKKTIYRFDDFWSFLDQYFMMIKDHAERAAEQKSFEKTMNFWWKIQVASSSLEDDEQTKMFRDLVKRKVEETMIAEKMKEIFDTLAILYKWKIDQLKIILQWRRDALEKIKQETDSEKTILAIAIQEAEWQKENWMRMMITLAAWFDFIEILNRYE